MPSGSRSLGLRDKLRQRHITLALKRKEGLLSQSNAVHNAAAGLTLLRMYPQMAKVLKSPVYRPVAGSTFPTLI